MYTKPIPLSVKGGIGYSVYTDNAISSKNSFILIQRILKSSQISGILAEAWGLLGIRFGFFRSSVTTVKFSFLVMAISQGSAIVSVAQPFGEVKATSFILIDIISYFSLTYSLTLF